MTGQYLEVDEVASRLGISRATVYRLMSGNEIEYVKSLNHRWIPEGELSKFIPKPMAGASA